MEEKNKPRRYEIRVTVRIVRVCTANAERKLLRYSIQELYIKDAGKKTESDGGKKNYKNKRQRRKKIVNGISRKL